MKKQLLFLLIIFSFKSGYSQTYNIYIVKEPEHPLVEFARDVGNMQRQMQKKFDYNYARLHDAISNISNQINTLKYPLTLKQNINYGWDQIIGEVNNCTKGNTLMDTSFVTQLISKLTSNVNYVISYEVNQYNGGRTYNNYNIKLCTTTSSSYSSNYNNQTVKFGELGENSLNYKFSFGYGFGLDSSSEEGSRVNDFSVAIRIGKKATMENLFEKFAIDDEQFAITSLYNYHTSFFSQRLFLVTGAGISYSKIYTLDDFESKFNPVLNLGLDYNFQKIPFSLGGYSRLHFGEFSSTGLSLKLLIK